MPMQPATPPTKDDAKPIAVPPPPPAASPAPIEVGPSVSTTPPPPPPDLTRMNALTNKLIAKFPSTKVDYIRERRLKVTVPPSEMKAVAIFVRDILGFDHIEVMGGTDYIATGEFEVIYFVGCVSRPEQEDLVIQLAERVKREDAPRYLPLWRSGRAQSTTNGRHSRCSG